MKRIHLACRSAATKRVERDALGFSSELSHQPDQITIADGNAAINEHADPTSRNAGWTATVVRCVGMYAEISE